MSFEPVSTGARQILSEIVNAKKPTKYLCDKYDSIGKKEKEKLRAVLHELINQGYLRIKWANNKPYQVIVTDSGRGYEEKLNEYENTKNHEPATSISIGNNNRISKSIIAGKMSSSEVLKNKSFFERHPVICSFLISLLAGIVLLFSFWTQIVDYIEGLF